MLLRPVLVLLGGLLTSPVVAENVSPDAKADVPALAQFHTVIRELWHEAWPARDYARMQAMLPEIEKGAAQITTAKLPAILHEKESTWRQEVDALERIVAEYRRAVIGNDSQALLVAGRRLHSQFEKLARLLRPAFKELHDFHATLYMIYHHYLPESRFDRIKEASLDLRGKMAALAAAPLPERLKNRQEAFDKARQDLDKAVDALVSAVGSGEQPRIKLSIETVHSRYQEAASALGVH